MMFLVPNDFVGRHYVGIIAIYCYATKNNHHPSIICSDAWELLPKATRSLCLSLIFRLCTNTPWLPNIRWCELLWNQKVKVAQSFSNSLPPHGLYSTWNSPARILEWVAFPSPGDLPTQGLNSGLPRCRWILYQLSHKGSPRVLEWVAYPYSRGSSRPRNWTGVSCIAGGFFINWAMREAPDRTREYLKMAFTLTDSAFKHREIPGNPGNLNWHFWINE